MQQLYEVVRRIDADLDEILREHNDENNVRVKDMDSLSSGRGGFETWTSVQR